MKDVRLLYHKDKKYYDYYVEGAQKVFLHRGKTIHIWHENGQCELGYMYGERYYTFNYDEILEQRKKNNEQREYNKERKHLMTFFETMNNDELREAIKKLLA